MDKQTEKLKQEINYLISKRTTFWTITIILISGTISMIFRFNEGLTEKLMLIIGAVFSISFINISLNCEESVKKLINRIGKEKE